MLNFLLGENYGLKTIVAVHTCVFSSIQITQQ